MITQFLVDTAWSLPLYGLVGAALSIPWAAGLLRQTGPRLAAYINMFATTLAFIHSSLVLRALWGQDPTSVLVPWLRVVNLDMSFALRFSTVSLTAASFVTGLALVAQIYALGYMEKDWGMARFFALLGFFEAAMCGVALSDSLLLSYALLEALTLSTYMLVGFWYAQPLVVNAARDAFLTKRVGDLMLLMGVVTIASLTGSLNFSSLAEWTTTAEVSPLTATLLGFALIAGPTGTCAQFPLHLWLDEAMEGPNPASIMRNSVVVTVGAYILIQLQPVLTLSPVASETMMVIGGVTAVGASLVAAAQVDIKRAISHTTSAYLGLVFIALGVHSTNAALLLLLTHGLAKALIFMSSGSVIFNTHTQDLTEMGGLGRKMPLSSLSFVVGSAAMLVIFPLGCFWGMTEWLGVMWLIQPGMVLIVAAVNAITAFNLTRIYCAVFTGPTQTKTRRAPEVAWPMAVPQVALLIVNVALPFVLSRTNVLLDIELLPWSIVGAVVAAGTAGAGLASAIYQFGLMPTPVKLPVRSVQNILAYDFYIDRLYKLTIVFVVGSLSRFSAWVDRYIVDGMVNLVGLATLVGGESLKYSNFGKSQLYLLTILLGLGVLGIVMSLSMSVGSLG